MAKYVVTGGAGFIGSNLVKELIKRGQTVKVIDNLSTGHRANLKDVISKINFVKGDITNLKLLQKEFKGADFILHQAALCSVPRSIKNPLATDKANITGTLNVLVAGRDQKIKRVVFASSSSVYGDIDTPAKIEEKRGQVLSPYAFSKLGGEIYCQLFYQLYGLETVVLRYFNVFGPYQDPKSQYAAVVPAFITQMIKNESPVIYGDGSQSRDFIFVQDVARANILAATTPKIGGQVFNIGSGQSITLNQLIKLINKILKAEVKPIYQNARSGDIQTSQADIKRAKKLLKFQSTSRLEAALATTIKWYQNG